MNSLLKKLDTHRSMIGWELLRAQFPRQLTDDAADDDKEEEEEEDVVGGQS